MSQTSARKKGRRGSPESWSVDTHVGQRVRMRRTLLGMSQEKLGEAIGLTFQQVQKYERGSNRISAGTLYRLSQILDVPVSFFFDCYEGGPSDNKPVRSVERSVGEDGSAISRREARLLRLWRSAPPSVADEFLALLSALAAPQDAATAEPTAPAPKDASVPVTVSRSDPPAERPTTRRPRRRHGAIWDPADIYRNAKA